MRLLIPPRKPHPKRARINARNLRALELEPGEEAWGRVAVALRMRPVVMASSAEWAGDAVLRESLYRGRSQLGLRWGRWR